jgi:hypothetical protein
MSLVAHTSSATATSEPTANESELDELVERWHNCEDSDLPLHEFLGISWDEYARWVQHPTPVPEEKL